MAETNLKLNNPGLVEMVAGATRAKNKEELIVRVEKMVQKKIAVKTKFLIDQAFELAAGIYVLDERDPSKTKYYKKQPQLDAIIYLMDRLLGKPMVKSENTNLQAKKGVAELQNIIQVLAGGQVNINTNGNERSIAKPKPVIDIRPGEDTLQE